MRCQRPILHRALRTLRPPQRRYARVHNVRFLVTNREPDKVFDKYRDKLSEKARREGLNSVSELKTAYASKIQEYRQKASIQLPQTHPKPEFPQSPRPPEPSSSTTSTSTSTAAPPGIKPLSAFLDVKKISALPEKEISTLWRLRHAPHPYTLSASIPAPIYDTIASTASRNPQFILPIPREGQGSELHFLQWSFPSQRHSTLCITHLAEYKLKGEFATPHTTITHHSDLRDSHGLVLLNGVVMEKRGVSVDEAKWLLICLQRFYGNVGGTQEGSGAGERRRRLLEMFNKGDQGFRIQDLIEEAEKVV